MSTDVTVLDQSLQFIHYMWKGPLEMVVFGYMIYREIGVCGWLGVGFIAAFVPAQSKYATASAKTGREDLLNETRFEFQFGLGKWRPNIDCEQRNARTNE